MSENKTSTANILSYLYNVVMGLSLITAVKFIITPTPDVVRTLFDIPYPDLLLFLSFLFTIIPFYQGAVKELIDILDKKPPEKKELKLISYTALLLEAILFYALSSSISSLSSFMFWFGSIMFVDIIWIILIYLLYSPREAKTQKNWAILNISMIVFLIAFWNFAYGFEIRRYALLFLGILIRSGLDYYLNWNYYLNE